MSEVGRIGVVITTHDRVDDARVSQELVRNVWGLDEQPVIVHAFNGDVSWYPETNLEDELVRIPNHGHFRGAAELIDAGCEALAQHEGIRYAVVMAADVWLLDGDYVRYLLTNLAAQDKRISAASWSYVDQRNPFLVGLSCDLFIIDLPWALEHGALPLDYERFERGIQETLLYSGSGRASVEKLMMVRLQQATMHETGADATMMDETLERILPMSDRHPIHPIKADEPVSRLEEWPEIGLIASHDPIRKREALQAMRIPASAGPAIATMLGEPQPATAEAG